MGIVQDLFDLIHEFRTNDYFNRDEIAGTIKARFGRSSLARKAGDAIMQFPVVTTDVISVQDLTMINKALEREYATFVRIAMGLEDSVATDLGKRSYVKQFHQNMNTSTSGINPSGVIHMESANIALLKPFSEDLRSESLNDLTNKNNRNHYILGEANPNGPRKIEPNVHFKDKSQYSSGLVDNDVKKANELVPTTLDIAVLYDNGEQMQQSNILLGVKTISHLVTSEEMVYNVAKAVEEKRGFFRFIQWTSGEISFFKDYLFMIDRIKKEATSQRSNSTWWRSLKRRSLEDKVRKVTFSKKELLPNATILITMDEVEYIQNNYNINLMDNTKAVKTIMDAFFLLGFVVVDPASELAYFFFDGQDSFQTFSYAALEREARNPNNELKAMVSLMKG